MDELAQLRTGLTSASALSAMTAVRPGVGAREAAVLALLGPGPEIVLLRRASTLRAHAGQVAFPGGGRDPDDADLVATALREAEEEIGLDPGEAEVIGQIPPVHVAVSGFDVTTVVARWVGGEIGVRDTAEVASVHRVPIVDLVEPGHRFTVRHPLGYRGPGFAADGLFIWGMTAHLLDGLLELAGWSLPWDTDRHREIPADYLSDIRFPRTDPAAH